MTCAPGFPRKWALADVSWNVSSKGAGPFQIRTFPVESGGNNQVCDTRCDRPPKTSPGVSRSQEVSLY